MIMILIAAFLLILVIGAIIVHVLDL